MIKDTAQLKSQLSNKTQLQQMRKELQLMNNYFIDITKNLDLGSKNIP